MPTGVALRDVRQQLFDAAERVLLQAGPDALTSRAVTAEAGCAKGVLHRHFADFDDFLAELVRRRIAAFEAWGATMCETAGSGPIDENIADVLTLIFDPVGLNLTALILSRAELRARLRSSGPQKNGPQKNGAQRNGARTNGPPLLAEATAMLAAYLVAEQARHRVPADADADILALTLVGSAHLAFAGGHTDAEAVNQVTDPADAVDRATSPAEAVGRAVSVAGSPPAPEAGSRAAARAGVRNGREGMPPIRRLVASILA